MQTKHLCVVTHIENMSDIGIIKHVYAPSDLYYPS